MAASVLISHLRHKFVSCFDRNFNQIYNQTSVATFTSKGRSVVHQRPPIFHTFDEGYIVRGMRLEDTKTIWGWYSKLRIISRFELEIGLDVFKGRGFYVGEYKGEVVASCATIQWAENIVFGCHLYVDERFRGVRGFGERLIEHSSQQANHNTFIMTIGDVIVESVAEKISARQNYSHTFQTRLVQGQVTHVQRNRTGNIFPVEDVPFDNIMKYDNKVFISENFPLRRRFLEQWFKIPGGNTYVALNSSNDVIGYGCRRPALDCQPNSHVVGPWYADSHEVANALIQRLLDDIEGDTVTFTIMMPNEAALEIVKSLGCQKVFDMTRVVKNGDISGYDDRIFAITSIQLCGF